MLQNIASEPAQRFEYAAVSAMPLRMIKIWTADNFAYCSELV